MLKVLIACEESQEICKAFRRLNHEAYSCDIQDCSGNHPEWHIKGDCSNLINGTCEFMTCDGKVHYIDDKWDILIAHPPCTYLTNAGNKYFNIDKYGEKAIQRYKNRELAIDFFMSFINANCKHICVENPIGCMSSKYRKPNQIIHPFMFGDMYTKATCLWTKGLPILKPTFDLTIEDCKKYHNYDPKKYSYGFSGFKDENGKSIPFRDPRTAKLRSKTFQGIAKAIAEQWSIYVEQTKSI